MKSFQKHIIKANGISWQLNINFKLCNFLQTPSLKERGGDVLAFEYQYYFILICLLMKQCPQTGWNPTGTGKGQFTYKYTAFDAAGAQMTLKLLRPTQLRNLV